MRSTAIAVLITVCGCGDNQAVLEVSLSGHTRSISSLSVGLEVATAPGQTPVHFSPQPLSGDGLDRLNVQLPVGATGRAEVQVDGLVSSGCVALQGAQGVQVTGVARYPLGISLLPPREPGCSVVVAAIGGGGGSVGLKGSDTPCDLSAGPCRWPFQKPAMEVQLIAEADSRSAFLGFSGGCTGGNPCVLRTGARATEVQVGFAPRRACTAAGWCWERPLPAGEQLGSVFALSESDIWAVGEGGTVLHSTGSFFAPVALPAGLLVRSFGSVWGRSSDEVYIAGGGGTILRWNGGALSQVPGGTTAQFQALTGSEAGVFVAGFSGEGGEAHAVVLRLDPARGVFAGEPGLPEGVAHLWGAHAFADQVLFVGDHGTILRLADGVWRHADAPTDDNLLAIWGASPDDFWVVGEAGTVLHRQLGRWTEIDQPGERMTGVSGLGADAWFSSGSGSLWHVSAGGQMQLVHREPGTFLAGVFIAGPRHVFTVGTGGTILRYTGTQVIRLAGGVFQHLRGIHAVSPKDIWAVGDLGSLWHYQGGDWQGRDSGLLNDFRGVWASQPNDLWIVGSRGLILRGDPVGALQPVEIVLQDGSDRLSIDDSLFGVYGTGPSDVWVVGYNGLVLHWNGGTWEWRRQQVNIGGVTHAVAWTDVWKTGDRVWVTGITDMGTPQAAGAILHLQENRVLTFPAGVALWGIRGRGNLVYAVGQAGSHGLILAGDGSITGWRVDRQDLPQPLVGIEYAGSWYATGGGGLVLRQQDGAWMEETSGASNILWDLHRDPAGKLWAVGAFGSILSKGP